MVITYIVQGIGYGFAGASQPGPFQTYLIGQTLKNGWRRSLPMALAPLFSDGPIIILVLLVLSQLPASMLRLLHGASGLFLLYLAWDAFASRRRGTGVPAASGNPGFLKAVFMNLISPGPYIYWSLVAGPTFLAGWRAAPAGGIGFLLGFYGTLVGTFGAVIVVFGTARRLGPKVTRGLLGASALALAGFGGYQLWLGVAG